MAETKQEETQKEFFNEFSGEAKGPDRFPSIQKTQKPILLNTSVEQLLLAGILLILLLCFAFFLGVLRGRALQTQPPSTFAPAAARGRLTTSAPPLGLSAKSAPVPSGPQKSSGEAKPYTIQLASYKKKDMADTEAAQIRRSGHVAAVFASGEYYVICAGQYTNKEEAKKDLQYFSSRYHEPFLRRRYQP